MHAAPSFEGDAEENDGELCDDDYSLAGIDRLASGFEHRIAKERPVGIQADVMDTMVANLARGAEVEVGRGAFCWWSQPSSQRFGVCQALRRALAESKASMSGSVTAIQRVAADFRTSR